MSDIDEVSRDMFMKYTRKVEKETAERIAAWLDNGAPHIDVDNREPNQRETDVDRATRIRKGEWKR